MIYTAFHNSKLVSSHEEEMVRKMSNLQNISTIQEYNNIIEENLLSIESVSYFML